MIHALKLETNFSEGVSPQFAGLNYTVTGEPRAETVKLPASIRGSRAGALPNQKVSFVKYLAYTIT